MQRHDQDPQCASTDLAVTTRPAQRTHEAPAGASAPGQVVLARLLEPLDLDVLEARVARSAAGAVVTFTGRVRNQHGDESVRSLCCSALPRCRSLAGTHRGLARGGTGLTRGRYRLPRRSAHC